MPSISAWRRLQPLVRLEVLYALQQRDLEGLLLNPALVRRLIKELEAESSARLISTVPDGQIAEVVQKVSFLGAWRPSRT